MAQIAYLNHEDLTRALVEAALQTREVGFTAVAGYEELIIKSEAGSFYHFPSLERLIDADAAALIGFDPPSGMSATDVQAALEELYAGIGGGSVVGTGTAGSLTVWASGTTLGNSSILSEAASKLLFSADAVATLYRSAASTMKTDAALHVAGLLSALAGANIATTLTFASDAVANLYRSAASVLKTDATFNAVLGLATAGQLVFNGDALAAIYRFSAGMLITSGNFTVGDELFVGTDLHVLGAADVTGDLLVSGYFNAYGFIQSSTATGQYMALIDGTFDKNTGTMRQWYGLRIYPTIQFGGSNSDTTVNLLDIDTDTITDTGAVINLIKVSYDGSQRMRLQSDGTFSISPDGTLIGLSINPTGTMIRESNSYLIDLRTASGVAGRCETSFQKSRGTVIAPTDVSTSDIVSIFFSMAFSGSIYHEGAKFQSVVDGSFTTGQSPPQRWEFYTAKANAAEVLIMALMSNGNIGVRTSSEFGSGEGVIGIQNRAVAPSTNPATGGVLYVESGALKYLGSGGTFTTIANA